LRERFIILGPVHIKGLAEPVEAERRKKDAEDDRSPISRMGPSVGVAGASTYRGVLTLLQINTPRVSGLPGRLGRAGVVEERSSQSRHVRVREYRVRRDSHPAVHVALAARCSAQAIPN
jgi:hypothetical protein